MIIWILPITGIVLTTLAGRTPLLTPIARASHSLTACL